MSGKGTQWKKKIGKKGLSLRKNKFFFGFFALTFAFIMMVSSTYAWTSYTEWTKNHMQSNAEDINVKVVEEFKQDSVINLTNVADKGLEKSVKVKNLTTYNALIRVKFKESIAPFEVDSTVGEGKGNGNLKTTINIAGKTEIKRDSVATWSQPNVYKSGKKDGSSNDLYYIASAETLKDQLYKGEANRSSAPLKIFKWQLNPAVKTAPDTTTTPYWVFDSATGYFYYSQVVKGGDTTAIDLLQKVLFQDKSVPNKYKYALYNIEVIGEGITANEAGLGKWTGEAGATVVHADMLAMYQKDPLFSNK